MYSRPAKTSHLDTIFYEIDMLRFCLNALTETKTDVGTKNLTIEGFLLHYRNLLRVFSGTNHRSGDLSTAEPRTWADRLLTQEEEQQIKRAALPLEQAYFNLISTYLQHCTEQRFSLDQAWDIQTMFKGLEPIIASFEQSFRTTAALVKPIKTSLIGGSSTATFTTLPAPVLGDKAVGD